MFLDAFLESDIPELLSWLENTDAAFLMLFAGPRYSFPLDDAQLRNSMADQSRRMFSYRLGDGTPIGHCQLSRIDPEGHAASIGRVLLNPSFRGSGLGTSMLSALIGYACESLGLRSLSLRVFASNARAISCYRRLGFAEISRESVPFEGAGARWECLTMELRLSQSEPARGVRAAGGA